jgi:hypothetical protein
MRQAGKLIPLSSVRARHHGPIEFFHFVAKLWTEDGHQKSHLSWADWTAFFAKAEECGMLWSEGSWDLLRPLHPLMTKNLVFLRRRAREAYVNKLTSWEFHQKEQLRALAEDEKMRQYANNGRGN